MSTATKVVILPYWSRWVMQPIDQGQIVEYYYATDGEYLYQKEFDRSDRKITFCRKKISTKADLQKGYDPHNSMLPKTVGKWERLASVEIGVY